MLSIKGGAVAPEDVSRLVSIKFTQNMPKDNSAKIDAVTRLNGIVSSETLFELLEPVTEVAAADEAERVAGEELAPAGRMTDDEP